MATSTTGPSELGIAERWVAALGRAAHDSDLPAFLSCIELDGWLRDILIFAPTLNARKGHDAISSYLESTFGRQRLDNFKLDTSAHAYPSSTTFGPSIPIIELTFDFETSKGWGKGHARLTSPKSGEVARAICVMMMLRDWKGHEELECEAGVYDGHNLSWGEVRRDRVAATERDPQAVIGVYLLSIMSSKVHSFLHFSRCRGNRATMRGPL